MGTVTGAVAIGSLVVAAAGTAVSVVGQQNAAEAQSKNAAYQAQVAQNNATIAAQNAEYTTQAGQEKAMEASLKAREKEGAVTTALAANGLDVNSGSASDVQKTQKESDTLGTQQIVDTAALQAYGYRSQGVNFSASSGLQTAEAGQATAAGDIASTGGLLAGASGVGLNYSKLVQSGAIGSSGPRSGSGGGSFNDTTGTQN